jgi:hypothetical protein
MKMHLENSLSPNSERPLVINREFFGGIFPHKGEKCVRVDPRRPWRESVRWIPVRGREVIVARPVGCSQPYLPTDAVEPEDLAKIPSWKFWQAQNGAGQRVWMKDLPAEGVRLAKDWRTYECAGPSEEKFTVPAGTRIIAGDSGDAAQAGYHWQA